MKSPDSFGNMAAEGTCSPSALDLWEAAARQGGLRQWGPHGVLRPARLNAAKHITQQAAEQQGSAAFPGLQRDLWIAGSGLISLMQQCYLPSRKRDGKKCSAHEVEIRKDLIYSWGPDYIFFTHQYWGWIFPLVHKGKKKRNRVLNILCTCVSVEGKSRDPQQQYFLCNKHIPWMLVIYAVPWAMVI